METNEAYNIQFKQSKKKNLSYLIFKQQMRWNYKLILLNQPITINKFPSEVTMMQ